MPANGLHEELMKTGANMMTRKTTMTDRPAQNPLRSCWGSDHQQSVGRGARLNFFLIFLKLFLICRDKTIRTGIDVVKAEI